MGQSLISYKGDLWRGRTTLSTNDRGDKRLVRITNGYVASDGHEIRSFPGWRTIVDLSEDNNPDGGYSRYTFDALRPPIFEPVSNDFYTTRNHGGTAASKQTLRARAKPLYYHAFEQVGGVLTIIGETRFREIPLVTSGQASIAIHSVSNVQDGGDFLFFVRMAQSPGGYTVSDSSGASLNGIAVGDTFYIEGLVVSGNDALQTAIDASVNGRVHVLKSISSGFDLRFFTDLGSVIGGAGPWTATAGSIHRVRCNLSDSYPTPIGLDPYTATVANRIDDLNALTSWRVMNTLPLSIGNAASHVCEPAWVANRQRDFSDDTSHYCEGIQVGAGTNRGVSRREQKELPYRVIPEPAGNRIIIAAPGYNCLFQIPLMVPFDPDNWPSTPSGNNGIPWIGNDIYDKPRALGIPKCRLIEPRYTPAPTTPGMDIVNNDINHMLVAQSFSPQYGFPAGDYRICATYQDDSTGEEGAPSEIIDFTVPANDYAYSINLKYVHPGYIMPECLANRINIYMSDTNGEALGFYKSFDLRDIAHQIDYLGFKFDGFFGSPSGISGKYGFGAGYSPDDYINNAEWRTLRLPLSTDLSEKIDFLRPPLNLGMPRGASCARYIRGALITCGHLGTDGPTGGLYNAFATIRYEPAELLFADEREIIIRQATETNHLAPEDGTREDGFGVASLNFPDSCEGVSAVSKSLIPGNVEQQFQVDKVVNRKSDLRSSASYLHATYDRLRTVRPVTDSDYRVTPAAPSQDYTNVNGEFFWKMFKGQVQIGDIGNPSRVSKAGGLGIQLIDPNRDDDGVSVFQLAGNAVICTLKETYFLSWSRDPMGEQPTLMSNEIGCIAPASMVEFDGGVAWISDRGPVAIGASLQRVGLDIQADFDGATARYLRDSKGMMRHTWACHDASRGLVLWGMVTATGAAETISDGRGSTTTFLAGSDGIRSRFPCDEVLIWSYRTNSFSTWVPPTGMRVLWMRQIDVRDETNTSLVTTRIAFLAEDGRIHMLDDAWSDSNDGCMTTTATAAGTASTSLTTAATGWKTDGATTGGAAAREASTVATANYAGFLVRVGQLVQAFDSDNQQVWETTVAAADPATDIITLAAAQTWTKGQTIRVGARPSMVIETTAIGSETVQTMETKAVQVRYTLSGAGRASADVKVLKSDIATDDEALEVAFTPPAAMLDLGVSVATSRHARRRSVQGDATATELAVRITVSAEPQVRIADLALEV